MCAVQTVKRRRRLEWLYERQIKRALKRGWYTARCVEWAGTSGRCWRGGRRKDLLASFKVVSRGKRLVSHQYVLFCFSFCVDLLYHIEEVSSLYTCFESFYYGFCQMLFLLQLIRSFDFFSFYLVDVVVCWFLKKILKQPHILKINPTWLWAVVVFTPC